MSSFLSVTSLSFAHGLHRVLSDVSFSLSKKELVSLVGINGAGKSSLLKILAGLVPVEDGKVFYEGKDINAYTRRRLAQIVSYLPQKLSITYPITAKDFVFLGRVPYSSPVWGYTKEDKQAVEQAIESLKISHLASRFMHQLSGGEQQKVIIASALAQKAKVILMDEPTASLDPVQQEFLYETLSDLKAATDACILVASHQLSLTVRYSDRVVALADNCVVFDGTAAVFAQASSIKAIYGKEVTL